MAQGRRSVEKPKADLGMADLSQYFHLFLENISLGDPQVPRMNSAANTVSDFLIAKLGLPASAVFLQGSYANQTAIEPVHDGEYDIDIVCVCVPAGMSADAALKALEDVFKSDGRFSSRVKRKNPCVRLEYAEDSVGKFHVDVVPVHSTGGIPALEAPRRGEGWHPTAPAEYTNWCAQQGQLYQRTVKMMKRWRDEQQTVRHAIKSVVLQVLIADHMPSSGNNAFRLAETFRLMQSTLSGFTTPPAIWNPVLPAENLAKRWTDTAFQSFKDELYEAVTWSTKAEAATDVIEAADAWRELLGDDFPIMSPNQIGIRVSDFSHADSPADMGWTENLNPRFAVAVSAQLQRGQRSAHKRLLSNNGQLVFAGHKLHFRAEITQAPNNVEVWWQVANTGGHARGADGLRGEIFRGRDLKNKPTKDPKENWESSSYTGAHLIRALLVRSNNVVAKSDWFTVNIYASRTPFSP